MPADGRPGDGKERGYLAGGEIAAGQGGHHLPACQISDRRERIHGESVTVQLRFASSSAGVLGLGSAMTKSAPTQLCQQRKLAERVLVGVPVDMLDAERRGLVEVGCDLFGRAKQRSALA